jgi:ubiquinone/menaquinone biosynthesis C-methylase UbiE
MEFECESFDLILCYEVLDYIPRDDRALAEMFRVLKPTGRVLLQVGFDSNLERSIEYAQPDADDSGHIRRYGRDLFEKFRAAGFEFDVIQNAAGASEADQLRFGLDERPFILLRRPPQ